MSKATRNPQQAPNGGAGIISLPVSRIGRRSAQQQAAYDLELVQFAEQIKEINSTLEFQISSRGWCYILEEHGLSKGEFDRAQKLLNDCRKSGLLPLDICKEDDARAVTWAHATNWPSVSAEDHAQRIIDYTNSQIEHAQQQIDNAWTKARELSGSYAPFGWYDGLDFSVFCLVEKIDLVTLFGKTCEQFHIPIANAKGWCDLHLRGAMARYFADGEEDGRTPVLLYCGDHDPAGLLISDTLKKNLSDMSRATGWQPDNLIVDRFGLNADFIKDQGLSWIENLDSGSGKDLSGSAKAYVQGYIRVFGKRKVEANTLVTRPGPARGLIAAAIAKYIPKDWWVTQWVLNKPAREQALAEFDRLIKAPPPGG